MRIPQIPEKKIRKHRTGYVKCCRVRGIVLVPVEQGGCKSGGRGGSAEEEMPLRFIVVVFGDEESADVMVQEGVARGVDAEFGGPGDRLRDEAFADWFGGGEL